MRSTYVFGPDIGQLKKTKAIQKDGLYFYGAGDEARLHFRSLWGTKIKVWLGQALASGAHPRRIYMFEPISA